MRTVPAACLLFVMMTCAGDQPLPTAPAATTVTASEAELVAALRANGLRVDLADSIQQPFFTPKANVYRIESGDLQVYEYADAAAAAAEAARISPNGSIGGSMPMWIAPPHSFSHGRVIVIYLGTDARVLTALTNALGPQIAGQ